MEKPRVIIVTDGDCIAKIAVEEATRNINGRCISSSAGNPTKLSGEEIINLIMEAPFDPIVVMVDDRGNNRVGFGEKAMKKLLESPKIKVIGIVAVASNTYNARGVEVDFSIDNEGNLISMAVDKYGNPSYSKILNGDTVNSLYKKNNPLIVGVGDPGKMGGHDKCEIGAPIITKALEKIVKVFESK